MISKETFIVLCELRKSLLKQADRLIEIGFDMESNVVKDMWNEVTRVEHYLEREFDMNTEEDNSLNLSLTGMDDTGFVKYWYTNEKGEHEVTLHNYEELYEDMLKTYKETHK